MVLAYHVIFTAYGFWLPNDPRGSWSDFVWAWELRRFGPATKTRQRRSLADDPQNEALRLQAKEALKFPAVTFSGDQAQVIGLSFGRTARANGYIIRACAILPEHVHMVVVRHRYRIEQVVRALKQGATTDLSKARLHPLQTYAKRGKTPTPWSRFCWKVFLDDQVEINEAIKYVEENPIKEGKRAQAWSCVTPYSPPTTR